MEEWKGQIKSDDAISVRMVQEELESCFENIQQADQRILNMLLAEKHLKQNESVIVEIRPGEMAVVLNQCF